MSKHHCRACGQGVCGPCSTHIKPVPSRGWDHPVRVCDTCHARNDSLWLFQSGELLKKCTQSSSDDLQKHCESWHGHYNQTLGIDLTALNSRTGISFVFVWKDKLLRYFKSSSFQTVISTDLGSAFCFSVFFLWATDSASVMRKKMNYRSSLLQRHWTSLTALEQLDKWKIGHMFLPELWLF